MTIRNPKNPHRDKETRTKSSRQILHEVERPERIFLTAEGAEV
jgi:hypothetical protein